MNLTWTGSNPADAAKSRDNASGPTGAPLNNGEPPGLNGFVRASATLATDSTRPASTMVTPDASGCHFRPRASRSGVPSPATRSVPPSRTQEPKTLADESSMAAIVLSSAITTPSLRSPGVRARSELSALTGVTGRSKSLGTVLGRGESSEPGRSTKARERGGSMEFRSSEALATRSSPSKTDTRS